ncbi:MAG TPA: tetratricopeptide repeat protein, partial [Pirellulales bacterium]|nr:tetratricopeptide repeat protein [Pirellulales bacterium]
IDYYNQHDVRSPEDLHFIGLAAAQFARWRRNSSQFSFLVNELYPDVLQLDENYWPAHLETGLLFLEKYNEAEASRSLKQALAINPNAAEVHAALAALALQNFQVEEARRLIDRAVEINPELLEAYVYRADSHLTNYEAGEAIKVLEQAIKLNPRSELALGRLAGAYAAVDGIDDQPEQGRLAKLIAEVDEYNAHAGQFYCSLATALELSRKFPGAARYYREAVQRMPQLTEPRGALGLMHMRLGDEVEAKKLLDESFEIDPFNVRVSNSLKVLEVLDGYTVLETEHFVLKFDRGQDDILARYAAKYLEDEVFPQLVKHFGYEPPGKSLFEIFSQARNTSGHGWFSARMVGLPYVGTVGACAGKMVAMASPNGLEKKFNWSRVLKHEFVHVLNLQQTHFNIPHWFTEALAVQSEGYPRPQMWDQLLAERVPKGDLFNLDNINLGFVRPKSSLDWNFAYCQSLLYAQCMLAEYGDDALAKMLLAYRDNLDTRAALQRCFDVEQEAFEQKYLAYIKQVVSGLKQDSQSAELSPSELEKALAADPDNADLLAQSAFARLQRKAYPQAAALAKQAIKSQPRHQLATYVLARLQLLVGETGEAVRLLEACLDREAPQENAVNLLAGLKFKAKQYDEAARLYELGAKSQPGNLKWAKLLARVYLTTGNSEKLAPLLAQLAHADPDDLTVRKKLAQLSLEAQDFAAAANWANQANQIDVQDPEIHRTWAEALAGSKDFSGATEEYEMTIRLAPDEPGYRVALAGVCIQAGDRAKARRVLEAALKMAPDHRGAKALLESLDP